MGAARECPRPRACNAAERPGLCFRGRRGSDGRESAPALDRVAGLDGAGPSARPTARGRAGSDGLRPLQLRRRCRDRSRHVRHLPQRQGERPPQPGVPPERLPLGRDPRREGRRRVPRAAGLFPRAGARPALLPLRLPDDDAARGAERGPGRAAVVPAREGRHRLLARHARGPAGPCLGRHGAAALRGRGLRLVRGGRGVRRRGRPLRPRHPPRRRRRAPGRAARTGQRRRTAGLRRRQVLVRRLAARRHLERPLLRGRRRPELGWAGAGRVLRRPGTSHALRRPVPGVPAEAAREAVPATGGARGARAHRSGDGRSAARRRGVRRVLRLERGVPGARVGRRRIRPPALRAGGRLDAGGLDLPPVLGARPVRAEAVRGRRPAPRDAPGRRGRSPLRGRLRVRRARTRRPGTRGGRAPRSGVAGLRREGRSAAARAVLLRPAVAGAVRSGARLRAARPGTCSGGLDRARGGRELPPATTWRRPARSTSGPSRTRRTTAR